jgi:hypothetical protein
MTYAQKFITIGLVTFFTVALLLFASIKGVRFVMHRVFGRGKRHTHSMVDRSSPLFSMTSALRGSLLENYSPQLERSIGDRPEHSRMLRDDAINLAEI